MKLYFIRNATMRLTYSGQQLLLDPFLSEAGTIGAFDGGDPNPLVELPIEPEKVIAGVDAVILSHLHIDHFDPVAQEMLDKDLPLFCQPGDEGRIAEHGFTAIQPVADQAMYKDITIIRTAGQHGSGGIEERMGRVSGFVLRASGEPTVYWCGDTIWYQDVKAAIAEHQPDVIITHSGGAKFKTSEPIVMDVEQTIAVCLAAPNATVIAIHMESLDHCRVTRAGLRAAAEAAGISAEQLLIPADGEQVKL